MTVHEILNQITIEGVIDELVHRIGAALHFKGSVQNAGLMDDWAGRCVSHHCTEYIEVLKLCF